MNHKASSNVKATKTWNGNTWHFCSKATGGHCTDKWPFRKPSNCEGCAFVPEHKRKNGTANRKEKRLKLSKAMQSLLAQVNQEDSKDSKERFSPPFPPTPTTLFQPNYNNGINWVKKIKEKMRCMLKRGRLKFRTTKLKRGAWVNGLMIINQSMITPPINCFLVMAMPTKTSTPRNDNVVKMDTD